MAGPGVRPLPLHPDSFPYDSLYFSSPWSPRHQSSRRQYRFVNEKRLTLTHYTMWDQLPKEMLDQVREVYNKNDFPFDVRLQLASWIEDRFVPAGNPNPPIFNIEDSVHQELATVTVNELFQELDNKVLAIPGDPDKFLMKNRLQEISEILKVKVSTNLVVRRDILASQSRLIWF